jgi:endonuclease/exonuclease/phosphatase family metal-dependent hydrolase
MTRGTVVTLILHLLAASAAAAEIRVATFNIGAYFGENYFEYSLGDPGTPDHDTVREILARIDADVVALQEIHSVDLQGSPDDLDALAAALGYPYLSVPPVTDVFDTSLRVVFLSRFPFLGSGSIAPPAGAKDMTRRHPMVKVDAPGTDNDPWLISVHLKAGTEQADRFRRAVEMRRLTGHLAAAGLTGDDNFIVLGDFNPSSTNTTFQSLPSGLPGTFALGPDIAFPVSYSTNMPGYFTAPSVVKLDARQLDDSASTYNTSAAGGPTLDLILVSPAIAARPHAAEIYSSALDISNSAGLPKAGSPLAAATSALASDHYAVFADLNLSSDMEGPYVFTAPGQTLRESFDGFTGNQPPARWAATGDGAWLGTDDGSSATQGWRAYGAANEGAPGLLASGAVRSLTAEFSNQSARRLTALKVAIDAGTWRAVPDGSADSLAVDLLTPAGTIPIETLRYVAGGNPATLTAVAGGLDIAPGASFSLRVSFQPDASAGPPPAEVFINEMHYDNSGTDADEFVEIVAGPGFGGNPANVALVLYNGNDGEAYATHTLDTFTTGSTTASRHRLFHKNISGMQNGDPDGLALVVDGTVRQFISYEGAFAATSGPAAGLAATDIGVRQNGTEPAGQSALGLTGTGGVPADFTWVKFTGLPHTPGLPNSGQSFIAASKPPQGLAFDNLEVTYLTDNDLDGLPDIQDPDDDNDSQSDADETAFGTDPLSAASRFAPALVRDAQGLALSFPAAAGVAYTVEMSETMQGWREHSRHTGAGAVIEVPLPAAGPRMFFRVRAGGP